MTFLGGFPYETPRFWGRFPTGRVDFFPRKKATRNLPGAQLPMYFRPIRDVIQDGPFWF